MAKALRQLGCRVTTICASRLDLGCHSRFITRWHRGPRGQEDPEGFLSRISEILRADPQDVVIPLTDGSATVLSQHKLELSAHSRIAVPDWPIFLYARDKLLTMRACQELGIPAPKTWLQDTLPLDPRGIGLQFPVVVKPRQSYGAIGFSRVDAPHSLAEVFLLTQARYGPALVQEYVPQTGLQYKAELMTDTDGSLKAAVVFSKIRWYPVNGGSSTLNVTVDRPDIIESCMRLLRHVNWMGYADIDLIQDPRDGLPKIMEINPRITGSVKIAFEAGVDFAEMVVRQALGHVFPAHLEYAKGIYLRYLLPDLLWLVRSPNRFSCRPSWFDFRRTTDQIFSFDDPLPGISFALQSLIRLIHERR